MSDNELRALNEISGRLGRLEALHEANTRATTELTANLNRLVEKLDRSDDLAREADQRARSAHHRLDKIDKIIFWIGTTVFGGILLAAVAFVVKGGLAK